jgi:hypothetical protein
LIAFTTATLLVAAAVPVVTAGPPGNNGTVKIHSGDAFAGEEPSPEIQNEPHVSCPFHAHFFFADAGQTGDWVITGHAPTKDNVGTFGSYVTGADGSYTTAAIELAPGHYKLSWNGRNDKNVKHKTFWVDSGCEGEGGGGGGGGGGSEG